MTLLVPSEYCAIQCNVKKEGSFPKAITAKRKVMLHDRVTFLWTTLHYTLWRFAEDESTAASRRFGLIMSDPVLVRLFFSASACPMQLLSRCLHFRRSLNSRAVLARNRTNARIHMHAIFMRVGVMELTCLVYFMASIV